MSATAQWAHDCILMCPLVRRPPSLPRLLLLTFPPSSHSFFLSQFILIFISFALLFLFLTISILIYMCYSSYQSFPPTQMFLFSFIFFFFFFQMPLHAKWSTKASEDHCITEHGSVIRQFFFFFSATAWLQFSVNIVIFHDMYSDAPINAQMIWPMFTHSQTEPL